MPIFGQNVPPGSAVQAFLVKSGLWVPSIIGNATFDGAYTANTIQLVQFNPARSFSIDRIAITRTIAVVAGALAKFAIYNSNTDGSPNTLQTETANLDIAAIATHEVAISFHFTAFQTYWIGGVTNANAIARAASVELTMPKISSVITPINSGLERASAFANAWPSTWVFNNADLVNIDPIAYHLRIA